jgi:pyruvate/2-oxoglutarate dehydrogenase complex dihydrolipoamide acyltransferase (E2) component
MAEVTIPKLGLTMTEGTVAQWLKPSGATVVTGEPVYNLVTDKVEAEVEAEAAGVLHHAVDEGTTAPCGALVGWVLAPGEVPPASPGRASGAMSSGAVVGGEVTGGTAVDGPDGARSGLVGAGRRAVSPNARRLAAELGVDVDGITGTGPGGRVVGDDVLAAAASTAVVAPPSAAPPAPVEPVAASVPPTPPTATEERWTPVARRLAARIGLGAGDVRGTGPGGRITLDDVLAASPPQQAAADAPRPPASLEDRVEPMAGMRKVIAERMHASLRDSAQLTIGSDADAGALLRLRSQLRSEWEPAGVPVPSVTDLLVKAVARALHRHPRVNAEIAGEGIHLLADVHIGVAVDVDDGLLVPVVRHADLLSVDELAAETARLGAAARSGALTLDEMSGATFTISNLGTLGVDFFTPILNPPNVAILGVGRVREVWDGPDRGSRRLMTLSLTFDHRALDGAPAARFLATLREAIESPTTLLAAT